MAPFQGRAYHGSMHAIGEFTTEHVGGRTAHDEDGPGIYFTTSFQDAARHWAHPCRHGSKIYEVRLNLQNLVPVDPPGLDRSRYSLLLQAAPGFEGALGDWDDDPKKALRLVLAALVAKDSAHDALQSIWYDFYYRQGASRQYVDNLPGLLGYDGVVLSKGVGVSHVVVYDASRITIEAVHAAEGGEWRPTSPAPQCGSRPSGRKS